MLFSLKTYVISSLLLSKSSQKVITWYNSKRAGAGGGSERLCYIFDIFVSNITSV